MTIRAHSGTIVSVGWYQPVGPPADLERLLACSWTARPSGRHLLVPDGCIDVLYESSGAVWICGPETTAWTFVLPDNTVAVGVRFRPGAAPGVFGFDASTIRDRRIRFGEVRGRGGERALSSAVSRAISAGDDGGQSLRPGLDVLERAVRGIVGRRADNDELAEKVLEFLAEFPRARQAALAAHVGISSRQLHRRSQQLFGFGIATLARLVRFQRLLSIAETSPAAIPLARLAVEAGYGDQAHLGRDCRAITGLAPVRFLADYFPTFPTMSDPYKTNMPFVATMAP